MTVPRAPMSPCCFGVSAIVWELRHTTSPLHNVGCVGTSATLGSSATAAEEMCSFATRVFGTPFDAAAVVSERRKNRG